MENLTCKLNPKKILRKQFKKGVCWDCVMCSNYIAKTCIGRKKNDKKN